MTRPRLSDHAIMTGSGPGPPRPPMSLLQADNLTKRFGDFTALDGVTLTVPEGTVLALLGENGAGKSTLMRIAYGLLRPDAGRLLWRGQPVTLSDPAAARRLGIGMVHQHFTLVSAMTVAENLALAMPPAKVTPRAMEERAAALSERTGIAVDPRARAGDLPVGLQQRVEILKALATPTALLILDEPTGVLAPAEIAELFEGLERLRASGASVILITHKLPEALAIADRVAVLRGGRVMLEAARSEVDADTLANAMVGRSLVAASPLPPSALGPEVVRCRLLDAPGDAGEGAIRAGETVGVGGVEGSGQSALAETLVGLRHAAPVMLERGGGLVDASGWSIADRIAWGLGHIPEDRHATALALTMSVRDNLFLAGDTLPRRGPWVDRAATREKAARLMEQYDVRASSMDTPVGALSGGNQQKAVVAREMSRNPRLLVAVNPTRGLDVAATEYVHDAIRAHRARGGATLLVSSELDELLALSDRILVLYNGAPVGALRPGGPDDHARIGRWMTGATDGSDAP